MNICQKKNILISFFFLGVFFSSLFSQSLEDIYEELCPSIVGLEGKKSARLSQKELIQKGRHYGTGFCIAPGLLVTTREVVQYGLEVQCTFFDRRCEMGQVVAYDEKTPLVLVKISRSDLPPLSFSDASIGEIVLSLGNSHKSISHDLTVAFSVGSLNEEIFFSQGSMVLQTWETDVAINPGNFGGPLLNLEGQVIGVIFSAYRSFVKLGLVLNSQHLKSFLKKFNKQEIPLVFPHFLTQTAVIYTGIVLEKRSKLAIVADIDKQSPAEASGLQVRDAILAIENIPLKDFREFESSIQKFFPDQKITLTIKRRGKTILVQMILSAYFM